MEGAEFMTYTGASHQGAIEMFWFHFWGAVMSSFFVYGVEKWKAVSHFLFLLCSLLPVVLLSVFQVEKLKKN